MELSEEGRKALDHIAARHGVSPNAVENLLTAIIAGGTTQAQFNHPDLGGMGQWSEGGMIMVGDMFNNGLKAKVDGLCNELVALVRNADIPLAPVSHQSQSQGSSGSQTSLFVPGAYTSANWWPGDLGHPSSTGAQNNLRYAVFPAARRLAIDNGGKITVYDTRDHQIGGFSQQQSGGQSLSFTSQHGLIVLSDLDVVASSSGDRVETQVAARSSAGGPAAMPFASNAQDDIFTKIERLAALHAKGILTDQEFTTKKAELLDRL